MSRAELAGAVRSGQVTPRALVLAAFDRIDQHADLNAVITTCRDRALAEAAVHPRTGRLAGLPVLVKDLADAEGMPTSQGSPWFATGEPAQSDDLIVRRLRAEGAIVIGKTNVPAFGHTAVTSNSLFGPTVNPWKRDRSPGGSSGGTACALAAGLSPLATGSDGGGSVRVPASLCGLVGYKPTTGAIGRGGVPRWIEFSTMGVTASTVDDVILEVDVCLGPLSAMSCLCLWDPSHVNR